MKKISSPMAIRMTPPRMEALPARRVPNFLPMASPAIQMKNVTMPMMSDSTNADAKTNFCREAHRST